MEKKRALLAEIQEIPKESLILVVGPPGAGKSTFCHQAVLSSITADRPIIFVTTERSASSVTGTLKEKGMGKLPAGAISFVDAFGQTVGLQSADRQDTENADCEDLNSISAAIDRLRRRTARSNILLSFDSLTSPYLFNREEIFRFLRLCLSKFASEGNSVLALMDEGCGKDEDIGAMTSIADGIIRMEIRENTRTVTVVKHPRVSPGRIEAPMTWSPTIGMETFTPRLIRRIWDTSFRQEKGKAIRTEVGDLVNMCWRNLALWSAMLWDPKRVPTMVYEFEKELHIRSEETISRAPWHMRLFMKFLIPRNFSKPSSMQRFIAYIGKTAEGMGEGIWKYLKASSGRNEHLVRMEESSISWAFADVGARLDFHGIGALAGMLKLFEKQDRDWNVVETRCIGLGDSCCEFRITPWDAEDRKEFLESIDSSTVGRVHDLLVEQILGFLMESKPLPDRPRLKGTVAFNQMLLVTSLPALFSERYRMALRMGGAKTGREIGERLIGSGMPQDEAIERLTSFMEHCRVGKVTVGKTIRIRENCESYGLETGEPSCFFTTGFLNGAFSILRGRHLKEAKCTAAGDPYCEWEMV